MQSTADHLDLAPPRAGRWLGPMGLALVVHALLIAALTWGVNWKHDDPTATFEAEIWSRLPQQAAPRAVPPPPEPKPEPEPAPPPEPSPAPAPPPPAPPAPNEAQIAVERAKKKAEAEKREREAAAKKAADAKKAEDAKKAVEAKAEAEKRAKADKERKEKQAKEEAAKREHARKQAEAQKEQAAAQERARQDQIRRMMGQAGASGGPQATGTAQQSSGPSPGYAGRVAATIKPNVLFTEPAPGNPRAEIEIRTLPDGTITSSRLVKSSGNKAWDDAALRAIERTGTLPRDTDGRVPSSLIIGLRPQD
ncbi:colicin import membrane protein [Hydrogenophaga palleronii]|uniref:Colicin import membrane protein n=1 Tax=Hydrogenophaga palleronii TaxID=65655 RepID=A0ABU1WGS5_9BURK|nr:cell envelope integrity protein TolA [Hydrogenophaga palleronii]MDR7148474.1 colicin import membrane protein [Hydrogenophaga palleronii]